MAFASSGGSSTILFSRIPYSPPAWLLGAVDHAVIPTTKVSLGRFPTPIHPFNIAPVLREDTGIDFWIKRDDLSSFDLSGNKVRKLEFLMAEALDKGCDSVITIGGVQSNHARATAVAARQLGLDPHLILRTRNAVLDDPEILNTSLSGNLMFNRLVDAEINTVTAATYATVGSASLLKQLTDQLIEKGRNPYPIPVGGSTPLGTFGYLQAMEEIRLQQEETGVMFDHICFSCGSGGTAAGLAIGAKLAGFKSVHAIGVCDSPAYFYQHIQETASALGIVCSTESVQDWLTVHHGSGIGYARSTQEELEFLLKVARSSGIVLDPVYSGKALYYFMNEVIAKNPDVFHRGDRVLFIHTGGVAGLYDKAAEIAPLLPSDRVKPFSLSRH